MSNNLSSSTENSSVVRLSDSAVRRLHALAAEENKAPRLRVSVQGGGCYGFQYTFEFADETQEGDYVFTYSGAEVVLDEVSFDILKGSEVDYVENLMGACFTINNPNASASCGCGSSFSVE